MDLQFLNDLLSAFIQAFDATTVALTTTGLTLLGVIALIAFAWSYRHVLLNAGAGLGEALGHCLLILLAIGVTYWICLNLPAMTEATYQTFFQWGAGGRWAPGDMLNPAAIVDQGFQLGKPIRTFTDNLVSWIKVWDWDTLLGYSLAYYAIVLAFFFIALALIYIVVEFKLAVMLGAVLIPLAVWSPATPLAEA